MFNGSVSEHASMTSETYFLRRSSWQGRHLSSSRRQSTGLFHPSSVRFFSSYECGGNQLDNEGMIHFVEQVLLSENVTLFPELCNLISVDLLDGDSIACGFNLSEPDLPIGAFSDDSA